jgi:hypothetical protein
MIKLIALLRLIQTLSVHFPCLVLLLGTFPDSYAHPLRQRDTSLKPFSCFFPCLIYVITHFRISSIFPCASYHLLSLSKIISLACQFVYFVEAEYG